MIFAQVPPTPVPHAPSAPSLFDMPDTILWQSAPDAVGVYNIANETGFFTTIQVLLVIILVVLFLGLLYQFIRKITRS